MVIKTEALSPATPLSFLHTESEENPKPLRKKLLLKRKREDHRNIIEDMTKTNTSLNQVQSFIPSFINYHFLQPSKGPKSELKNLIFQLVHVNASVNSSNSMAENQWQKQMQMPSTSHYPPMMKMLNQTSGPSQIRNSVGVAQFQNASSHPTTSLPMPFSSAAAQGKVNSNTCPLAIPDVNLLSEEFIQVHSSQPFDEIMANKDLSTNMAAQIRQRRIQTIRLKNPIRNSKSHSS